MTTKTKVFSLLVLVLLFLPIAFNSQRSGQVLGTNESGSVGLNNSSAPAGDSGQPIPAESQIKKQAQIAGDIASGVRSYEENSVLDSQQALTGKAIVNMNTSLDASSDKFPLGTSLRISNGDNQVNVVVQGKSVLSPDTLIVLNQDIFQRLGGDPETGSMQVTVSIN